MTRTREDVRAVWTRVWRGDLVQDVRHALRGARRSPGFTATALLMIALGVGGTSAVFSVVYAVLLRPLPYPDPDRIVSVADVHPGSTSPFSGALFSNLSYTAWQPGARTIEALGAYGRRSVMLTGSADPERIAGTGVTPSLFRLLRVAPAAGRLFLEDDAVEGANPVIVLSHRFWRSRFGGDPSAVGRTVILDGQTHEIVGIAPQGFEFPGPAPVDFYAVFRVMPPRPNSASTFQTLARLAPGVTPEQAATEATAAARSVERTIAAIALFGEGGPVEVRVERLLDDMTARVRPALLLLGAATAMVLLIACANLASLFLSRGESRSRELAMRAALGARRIRLVRQLLTESLTLALAGGAIGLFAGWALVRAVPALAPAGFPRLDDIRVDMSFIAIALAASVFVGVASGILPAVRESATALGHAARTGDARRVSRGGSRTRSALLACEAALAVMLLVGAVLLARSFTELVQVDAGYDADRVLVATIHFTGAAREPGRGPAALDRILQRVRAMPGIEAAGAGNMAPFSGVMARVTLAGSSGWTGPDGQPITVRAVAPTVTPGYAEALRLRLRTGRFFHDDDGAQATTPVIVNETFARLYVAGREPAVGGRIERRIRDEAFEIVGIVGDFLPARLDATPEPEMFLPQPPDRGIGQMTLVVRTTGDPSAFAPTLRSIVRDVESAAVLDGVGPLEARVAESVAQPRFAASVLAAFATLALLLAASGLYGVLSYVVSQRRRELGIRAALGGGRAHLMALVLRHGFAATAAGLLIGLAGAAATTRLMDALLFSVSPLDAASFATAPAVLAVVALAACLVPALRASAVDPSELLRTE